MSVRADAQTLGQIPIFQGCDPVHLQLIAFSSKRENFERGDAIILQGKSASAAYLILSGEANLHAGRGATQQDLGLAEPGTFLGEVAMISLAPYSISAVANSAVTAARIDHDLFIRVAEEYPEFGAAVFENMSKKLGESLRDLDRVKYQLESGKTFADL
jgi:CRP-like cAMP-binding protein